jgi:hypothetical protein
MENETPIQTESVVPTVERHVAYMMMQGSNHLQYKAYRLVIDENDKIVEKTMIGNPDLKAVVFGRLLKLLFVMR